MESAKNTDSHINIFTTLCTNPADDKLTVFLLFFPKKSAFTFDANYLQRDKLHEMSNCFSGKSKKTILTRHLVKFLPSVIGFKEGTRIP